MLPHLPDQEWGFYSRLLQAFPQPLSRNFFCTLKQKAPDTWWVSFPGHPGVAEVFVLYMVVVVNTMSQVKYRFMLKKLRLALGVSYPFAPIIHIFQQQTQLWTLRLSLVGECNGSSNVEDTLIYFVSKFIVDNAFLLYDWLLNGPQNSRPENATWQPRIAINVHKIKFFDLKKT